jgi:hypothetical protein
MGHFFLDGGTDFRNKTLKSLLNPARRRMSKKPARCLRFDCWRPNTRPPIQRNQGH